ncbi:MAG: phage major capsid protein [Anaerolineae bacterium]
MTVIEVAEQEASVRACSGVLLPDEIGPRSFEVICMREGRANGLLYSADVLWQSVRAGLWEGCTVFANHPGAVDAGRAGGRAIEDVVGVLSEVCWTGRAIVGSLTCSGPKAQLVVDLAREVLAAQEDGRPAPNIGLSADMYVEKRPGQNEVTRIVRVNSLDVVHNPAAGGAFLRALNDRRSDMEETMVVGGQAQTDQEAENLGLALQDVPRLVRAQCGYLLEMALRGTDLPQPLKDEVRAQFAGKVFQPEELEQSLAAKQGTWARLLEGQVVRGAGPRVSRMRDGIDQIRLAAERLFGLPVPEEATAIPRLDGLRELYLRLTGDRDFHGHLDLEHVELANVTTDTMANVTADVLNKVMLQAYNRRERWWEPIVANRDLQRFQQMKMVRVHGFSTLSTVTQGAAYSEKTWDDLRETAEIVKKGNYVGVTLEMIMADDLESVRAIPQLLGSAAYNTVADTVAAVFTTASGAGPLMADGNPLFTVGRGNLTADTLAFGSFDAGQVAIMSQTEPGSGRKLGVPARYLLVPVSLRSTGMVIRNSINQPGGSENDVNPWYNDFDVVVVPPWTNSSDWALATDPSVAEHVVLGWLQGKREPEIFAASDEMMGSMFTNDELRVKVRFFLCCGVADYRGLYKANVA